MKTNTEKKTTVKKNDASKKVAVKKNETVAVSPAIAGYVGRVRVGLKGKMALSEIAAAMNKPLKEVREWIKLAKAIEKRNERIRKQRKKGVPVKDIAAAEGVSVTTVRRVLKEG